MGSKFFSQMIVTSKFGIIFGVLSRQTSRALPSRIANVSRNSGLSTGCSFGFAQKSEKELCYSRLIIGLKDFSRGNVKLVRLFAHLSFFSLLTVHRPVTRKKDGTIINWSAMSRLNLLKLPPTFQGEAPLPSVVKKFTLVFLLRGFFILSSLERTSRRTGRIDANCFLKHNK